jgi:hypothetical protein
VARDPSSVARCRGPPPCGNRGRRTVAPANAELRVLHRIASGKTRRCGTVVVARLRRRRTFDLMISGRIRDCRHERSRRFVRSRAPEGSRDSVVIFLSGAAVAPPHAGRSAPVGAYPSDKATLPGAGVRGTGSVGPHHPGYLSFPVWVEGERIASWLPSPQCDYPAVAPALLCGHRARKGG